MTRTILTAVTTIALLATSACSDMSATKTTGLQTMQVSSVHWDEMAAATSAAHVSNNGLIMMR